MPEQAADIEAAHREYRAELVAAGLLIRYGVDGVYGLGGTFEGVIEKLGRLVSRTGADLSPEVVRFPPLLGRGDYLRTDHLDGFPNLIGSVHSFAGNDRGHQQLLRTKAEGGDWSRELQATDLMLCPAACYPLYPTVAGTLPSRGRIVDLRGFVFRREPSCDPARMQMFRQHEFVRLGTPQQALAHRDEWLARGEALLRSVGLDPVRVVANDPFFGRGGRVMVATQREQALKYELVVPIATAASPTAVVSSNCHLDHFGVAFGIRTSDGAVAHSACVGFGLERIALALFRKHGFDPAGWPHAVRAVLDGA